MERIFIESNFPNVDIVPVSNGNSWTTDAISKQIISKFRAKRSFPQHIIVWIDRESNNDSPSDMCNKFRSAFTAEGYPGNQVHCLIPDKMCENIILSHEKTMKELTKNTGYTYQYEGRNGKNIIKEIYKLSNISYKETTHGPRLLKKIKLSECNNDCLGVGIFLQTFPLQCPWIS
jgi:hypothetical protein